MNIKDCPVIMLAGGASRRMGTPKGLLDCRGQLWLLTQLDALSKRATGRVVTVLGYHATDYKESIPVLGESGNRWTDHRGISVATLTNPSPEHGPFSSLMCAARWLKETVPPIHLFVLPIDVPVSDKNVWQELYAAAMRDKTIKACIPQYDGKGGHPACLSFSFLETLMEMPPDAADARLDAQILRLDPSEVRYIAVQDAKVTRNLNSLEDWQEYLYGSSGRGNRHAGH